MLTLRRKNNKSLWGTPPWPMTIPACPHTSSSFGAIFLHWRNEISAELFSLFLLDFVNSTCLGYLFFFPLCPLIMRAIILSRFGPRGLSFRFFSYPMWVRSFSSLLFQDGLLPPFPISSLHRRVPFPGIILHLHRLLATSTWKVVRPPLRAWGFS